MRSELHKRVIKGSVLKAIASLGGIMYNNIKSVTLTLMLFALLCFSGCASTSVRYINPAANFSYLKKVAVLPFNNLSDDRYAGEKVRSSLTVELMSRLLFDVVEQGEVSKVLAVIIRQEGYEEGRAVQVDKETLNLIGEKLGVQAVVLGSVDDYSGTRAGTSGLVAVSIRMLDTGSGTILWQVKVIERGASFWRRIVGVEEIDATLLTRQAVKKALDLVF